LALGYRKSLDSISSGSGIRLLEESNRLQEAKRRALAIADERSKENVALRAALHSVTLDD
jgi:hypothetical protein